MTSPKFEWPIDFCHDCSQLCRRARQGRGTASAFGAPVHRGCNDSFFADYRRIPSGSRGGERAGARVAPACEAAGEVGVLPLAWAGWEGAPVGVMLGTGKPREG